MKQVVKDLLEEMVKYGTEAFEKKITKNAYEKMEFSDLDNLIGWLLHWQKDIKHGYTKFANDFFDEYYLLTDVLQRRFKQFFDYCPGLSEVFQLKGDRIIYNPSLTIEEKQEILDFIDANHIITIVKVRKR